MGRIVVGETSAFGEPLVGAIDGANLVFTTSSNFLPETLRVYFNGIRLTEVDDYAVAESGGPGTGYDQVTFVAGLVPKSGDHLLVDYSIA